MLHKVVPKRFLAKNAVPSLVLKKNYSTQATTFFHKDLQITQTTTPKEKVPDEQLIFGKVFTDHMLEAEWTAEKGWGKPRIVPYHDLVLPPSCSVFQYAIECFEGMKAYNPSGNKTYLFRPELNAQRLNVSCQRIGLPTVSETEFLKCLAELVNVDKSWIPHKKGYSLYIRPTCISTEPTLGVSPPGRALMYVILSPVGPYFRTGFKPIKLLAEPKYVRAFPGGTGYSKIGANYAPTIFPQQEAAKKGYNQVLWLINNYGKTGVVSEVGTMNMFFYWINEQGQKELITAPLDGTILPGVTRKTIIEITKSWGMNVQEKVFTIHDVCKASEEGRIIEAFGAGTACIVSPVSAFNYMDKEYQVPVGDEKTGLAQKLFNHILSIQNAEIPSPYIVTLEDILKQ